MPTELHLALQRHYAGEDGQIEAPVDGYRADVLRDGVIYEVQTGNFSAIRRKVAALARRHPVVLVYPIPGTKVVVRLSPETGEELSSRRSPKRGQVRDVLAELLFIAPQVRPRNVALEVVLTEERELRCDDGKGSWRRKGVSVVGRELVRVVSAERFERPADFLRLLPDSLPPEFTVGEMAEALAMRHRPAGRVAYALRELGALRHVGKRGNAFVYRRAASRRR